MLDLAILVINLDVNTTGFFPLLSLIEIKFESFLFGIVFSHL